MARRGGRRGRGFEALRRIGRAPLRHEDAPRGEALAEAAIGLGFDRDFPEMAADAGAGAGEIGVEAEAEGCGCGGDDAGNRPVRHGGMRRGGVRGGGMRCRRGFFGFVFVVRAAQGKLHLRRALNGRANFSHRAREDQTAHSGLDIWGPSRPRASLRSSLGCTMQAFGSADPALIRKRNSPWRRRACRRWRGPSGQRNPRGRRASPSGRARS